MGKVDDLFMDANDRPEYIGVKMGFLGTHSTLIPFEMATVDDERKTIVLSTDKETAKNGPSFDDDREITSEFEIEVYAYYGLQQTASTEERGAYSDYSGTTSGTDVDERDELRVQRTEEELVAGTREVEAGQVIVRKRVVTDRERIEVPTRHEEVTVERVPVSESTATEAE